MKFSCIPHKDVDKNSDERRLASVIYLFNDDKRYGGTIIYKKNLKSSDKIKKNIIKKMITNRRYCFDSQNILFTPIFNVKNKFNRFVIYPTHVWHQGNVDYKYFNTTIKDDDNLRFTIGSFYIDSKLFTI